MKDNRHRPEQHPMGGNNPEFAGDDDDSFVSQVDDSEAITDSHGNSSHVRTINQKKQEAELLSIVKAEDKAVSGLRILLNAVLLLSAVLVAVMVYLYSSGEETDSFETQFQSDAQKLFESIGTNFDLSMGKADAFTFRIVSQARSTNSVWPMVTIPDLAVQAAKLISQTDSIYVSFYPLITGDKRQEWENFTRHNDGWVEEALRVQSKNPNFHGPILKDYSKSPVIWNNEGPESEDNPGPFLPSWMGSPVIPHYYPYGWNSLAYPAFAKGLLFSMETKSVVVTSVANHADPNDPVAVAQAATTSDWAIPFIEEHEDPNEPFSDMYYPVIDQIDDVIIEVTNQTKALGIGAFSFYWRHALKHSLPPNSQGVIIVFENPCGDQVFTYQIDGKTPTFLGFKDTHDETYDGMSLSKNLTELTNVDGLYTGRPMNDEFCPFTLTVYPSKTMEEKYVTTDPVVYAVAVALIFFFTSVLFLAYDWFVNRRQALIKQRAMASGAIVSSLFPDQVRNQLYEENQVKDRNSNKQVHEDGSGGDSHLLNVQNSPDHHKVSAGRPNAHLYEGTTIFFADLVGFTAWSGKRTPTEVFELLETLYGAFDKIAARRGVFKIETIGDCYVAVTGIPEPQSHHALIMVKFADEVLKKVHAVTRNLAETLGEDTNNLTMRVGLHSGSTTAGVLRGDKGRFQLFGDTVNTAARCESNGVANRIQVSQATANELIKDGKSGWLIPRKEKIVAKGKGEMQTYFVAVKRSSNTEQSSKISSTMSDGTSSSDSLRRSSCSDGVRHGSKSPVAPHSETLIEV